MSNTCVSLALLLGYQVKIFGIVVEHVVTLSHILHKYTKMMPTDYYFW